MNWIVTTAGGWVTFIVRMIMALLIALAVVQLVGIVVMVATIIAYHSDPQWYYIATGLAGTGVFLLSDVD